MDQSAAFMLLHLLPHFSPYEKKTCLLLFVSWQNVYSSPLEEELVTMVTCGETISIICCNGSDFPVLIPDCTFTKDTPTDRFVP